MKPELIELDFVPAEGGGILKIINESSAHYLGFGELYFSQIALGVFRGWKRHTKMDSFVFVVEGIVSFHFYEDDGTCQTFSLEKATESRVGLRIPHGISFGFIAKSHQGATLANFAQIAHSPEETIRPTDKEHECEWGK